MRDDEERSFLVDSEALIKVIDRRTQVPGHFKLNQRQDLLDYIKKFGFEGNNKIDYKDLVEDIQRIDEGSIPASAGSMKSGLTDAAALPELKSIFEEEYIVLD